MRFLVTILLCLLPAVSAAGELVEHGTFARERTRAPGLSVPPPQFDHPFPGTTRIHWVDLGEVYEACGRNLGLLGCARLSPARDCIIYLANHYTDEFNLFALRHETGHCNQALAGRPMDHAGWTDPWLLPKKRAAR